MLRLVLLFFDSVGEMDEYGFEKGLFVWLWKVYWFFEVGSEFYVMLE